jgi:hypothetical protein
MKKIFGISVLALIWLLSISLVNAQEKEEKSRTIQKELKVTIDDESGEPTYTVETTTTENGEKKVVKKTYNSLEEMKDDSSIDVIRKSDENGNITMKLGDKGSNVYVFTGDDGETIDITIDDMSEDMEWAQAGEDDGDTSKITKSYKVKVIKDEDHEAHQIHEHKNVFVIKDEDGNISMSHGGDDDVMVWVDESGHKTIKKSYHVKTGKASFTEASIQPITAGEEDFSAFNLSLMPELLLKSINYYPNPNQGEFTLAFTGSKKPVIVRILDLKGNMKMEENIEDFNGTFNQVLNVKHFDKGTYLLQIFQQDKVLNRKLVLE